MGTLWGYHAHQTWSAGKSHAGGSVNPENHRTIAGGIVAMFESQMVPSGKHTKHYGKSPCLMGKSTINSHVQ